MVSADGAKFGDGSPKGVVKSKGFPIYKDGHLLSMRGHMHGKSPPSLLSPQRSSLANPSQMVAKQ